MKIMRKRGEKNKRLKLRKLKQHHLRHLIATKSQDQQNSVSIYRQCVCVCTHTHAHTYSIQKEGGIFYKLFRLLPIHGLSYEKHLINV